MKSVRSEQYRTDDHKKMCTCNMPYAPGSKFHNVMVTGAVPPGGGTDILN